MKPLEEMTWEELTRWNQAKIMLAIPVGKFNDAVEMAMDLTLRWKAAQVKKEQQ